jgi:EREBP-like factor
MTKRSRYRGVHHRNDRNLWRAVIHRGRKRTYIGAYVSEEDAARAYDHEARRIYGEDARLNFPDARSNGR